MNRGLNVIVLHHSVPYCCLVYLLLGLTEKKPVNGSWPEGKNLHQLLIDHILPTYPYKAITISFCILLMLLFLFLLRPCLFVIAFDLWVIVDDVDCRWSLYVCIIINKEKICSINIIVYFVVLSSYLLIFKQLLF